MIKFDPPRQARIMASTYHRFGAAAALAQKGLFHQECLVVEEDKDKGLVFAEPDDRSSSFTGELIAIRKDIVEFLPES